jgi:hypothetical protein
MVNEEAYGFQNIAGVDDSDLYNSGVFAKVFDQESINNVRVERIYHTNISLYPPIREDLLLAPLGGAASTTTQHDTSGGFGVPTERYTEYDSLRALENYVYSF